MSLVTQASTVRFEQDSKQLEQFVRQESQAAFAEIVKRHLPFVYATCLRAVGDADLAQDATQVVFLILARKASTLYDGKILAAWLFQTARLVSRDLLKKERRRMHREEIATQQMAMPNSYRESVWQETEPLLNEALAELSARDRDALLLRYIEGMSLKETGAALGLTEGATNMRVSRAPQKMRRYLNREGIVLSASLLAALIAESTARSAPVIPVALKPMMGEGTKSAILSLLASARLARLARGVEQTMRWLYWKSVAAVTVTAVVCTIGVTTVHSRTAQAQQLANGGQAKRLTYGQMRDPATAAYDASDLVVPPSLAGLTLPDNGTLTFLVHCRNVRTAEMVDAIVAHMHNSWLANVHNGTATLEEAQRNVDLYRQGLENEPNELQYRVTLSARDGKLLLLTENLTPEVTGYVPQLYVYDGQRALTVQTWPAAKPAHAAILPGMFMLELRDVMPLPGVGLKSLPLLKLLPTETAPPLSTTPTTVAGRLPNLESSWVRGSAETRYSPGHVQVRLVNGRPQALEADETQQGSGGTTKWEYSRHQLFSGVWLAGRSIRSTYINGDFYARNQPARIVEYELQSISATPLPAERFAIESYLQPSRTVIQWYANGNNNAPHFLYDPTKGNLEMQAAEARAVEEQVKQNAGR